MGIDCLMNKRAVAKTRPVWKELDGIYIQILLPARDPRARNCRSTRAEGSCGARLTKLKPPPAPAEILQHFDVPWCC